MIYRVCRVTGEQLASFRANVPLAHVFVEAQSLADQYGCVVQVMLGVKSILIAKPNNGGGTFMVSGNRDDDTIVKKDTIQGDTEDKP